MPDFVVSALLRFLGGASETVSNLLLARFLKIQVAGESIRPKTLTIIGSERVSVGDTPRFHCLNHKVDPLAVDALDVPSVTIRQMIDGSRADRVFRIDEKHHDSRLTVCTRVLESLVCLVARSARDELPTPAVRTIYILDLRQKPLHTLT